MGTFRTVLVADDEASIRHVLTLSLTQQGYDVRAVADGDEALRELERHPYDVLVTDVRMPRLDGLALLPKALELHPELTVLVMSAYGSPDDALAAVRLGAYDYVPKPFKPEELILALQKAEERQLLRVQNRLLWRGPDGADAMARIVGESPAMATLKKQIRKIAPAPTTALIVGESGTGKELIARALHELSLRAPMPFMAVNCGAIPAGLLESELFGHAKGAFTGASAAKRGLLSEADRGTVFLDEVGELPLAAQVKLLRFLQEGEVRPVGDSRIEHVEARVVAATLRDLSADVASAAFREDLYYRLNVVSLEVPPLRARGDDVLTLAQRFLDRFGRTLNREQPLARIDDEAAQVLRDYRWPGNVRELENAMERAALLADGDTLRTEHLPDSLLHRLSLQDGPHATPRGASRTGMDGEKSAAAAVTETAPDDLSIKRAVRSLEERYLREALRRTKGNRTRAAELLELSHRALLYKVKDYGIDPHDP